MVVNVFDASVTKPDTRTGFDAASGDSGRTTIAVVCAQATDPSASCTKANKDKVFPAPVATGRVTLTEVFADDAARGAPNHAAGFAIKDMALAPARPSA